MIRGIAGRQGPFSGLVLLTSIFHLFHQTHIEIYHEGLVLVCGIAGSEDLSSGLILLTSTSHHIHQTNTDTHDEDRFPYDIHHRLSSTTAQPFDEDARQRNMSYQRTISKITRPDNSLQHHLRQLSLILYRTSYITTLS